MRGRALGFGLSLLVAACGGGRANSSGSGGGGAGGGGLGGASPGGGGSGGSGGGAPTTKVDVLIAGAGIGGIAAAVEAARQGHRVLLVEPTGDVGGQKLLVAGPEVMNTPSTRTGLVVDFQAATSARYLAEGKPHGAASLSVEPHIVRQVFTQMLADAHVELRLHTRVTKVTEADGAVTGATLSDGDVVTSKVLIDATEFGDVIPLTGAPYRLANHTSDALDPNACVQSMTYAVTMRRYSGGVPAALVLADPPPGYDEMPANGDPGLLPASTFGFTFHQAIQGMVTATGSQSYVVYPFDFYFHNQYREMPDSANPVDVDFSVGQPSYSAVTRTAINLTNDYVVHTVQMMDTPLWSGKLSSAYVDDPKVRARVDCFAKRMTLDFIYYMQQELQAEGGDQWSIADDEGFDQTGDFDPAACPDIPSALKPVERLFPPTAYVRESRRIVPIKTLTGAELLRATNGVAATAFHTAIARGDGALDVHDCHDDVDLDLGDTGGPEIANGGPIQIPFEALVPVAVDGFLAAEKNIGVSRLAAGAVRLQGNAFRSGQAIGALAALAIEHKVQPRKVDPFELQRRLVAEHDGIWFTEFDDVPTDDPHWGAVQLVATRGVMIGTGATTFDPAGALTRGQAAIVLATALKYDVTHPPAMSDFTDVAVGDPIYPYVEALFTHGVTSGCGTGLFCPSSAVTREQFAVFLTKALALTASGPPLFDDVDSTYPLYTQIQAAAEAGLLVGCTSTTFCPTDPLTRGDAAESLVALMVRIGPP